MVTSREKRGFTLIELLVVVAIIVILIAILIPALTAALYAATLANCSANMDGVGTGVTVYAHGNKERYPYRPTRSDKAIAVPGVATVTPWWVEQNTIHFSDDAERVYDDRPILQEVTDYNKTLQDPFLPPVTLNKIETLPLKDESGNYQRDAATGEYVYNTEGKNAVVRSSYALYFGFGYRGEGRMEKLGSSVTWQFNNNVTKVGPVYSWDLLMADMEYITDDYEFSNRLSNDAYVQLNVAGHPDKAGSMTEAIWDGDQGAAGGTGGTGGGTTGSSGKYLFASFYWTPGTAPINGTGPLTTRSGLLDRNFLRSDGSVESIRDIKIRDEVSAPGPNVITPTAATAMATAQPRTPDERFVVVPWMDDSRMFGRRTMLPVR